MASPNVSEIITTTLESRSGKLADNMLDNNALLARLRSKGKVKPFSGGRKIYQELEYNDNGTVQAYSGFDTLDVSPSDVFTAAEFDIKQYSVAITASGLELLQNAGKEQVIDLLESRISNAEKSLLNRIAADIYGDGTSYGGKVIGGLQLLVADAPTSGTVGGINRATWSFWQNQVYDASADGGAATSAANIQAYFNSLYLECSRGKDMPDLIVCDNAHFKFYWSSLQALQRFGPDSDVAKLGFQTLKFMKADVVFDGGQGGNCPASHTYMLNTDYIHWRPHTQRNFVPIGADRFSVNQDAMVKLLGFAGNLTVSNCALQGVLKE